MRPTPRAVVVLAALTLAAAWAAIVRGPAWVGWLAAVGAFAAAVAADASRLPRRKRVTAEATVPGEIPVGSAGVATIDVAAPAGPRVGVRLILEADPRIEAPGAIRTRLAGGRARVRVPLRALARGRAPLERVWLAFAGPWGLARRVVVLPLDAAVDAVPDLRGARGRAIRAFDAPDARVGSKVERYDGDGSEFDALREFRVGDDHRAIDWKASARHRSLLRRQFRAERDHDVVIAVDAGRLMAERVHGVPKLDLALGAALRFAYVALKTGDRVGFFGFDERPRIAIAPQGGVPAHAALLRAASRLEAREVETNFTLSLSTLLGSLRRRALVVVVTDFADTVSASLLLDNLRRLKRRHAVLFAALADPHLGALEEAPPHGRVPLHRAVIAGTLKRERRVVLERLRRMGVPVVVAPAEALGAEVIDRYLDMKRREVA